MSRAQRFAFRSIGFAFRLHLKSKRSDTASLCKQNCNVDLWAYNNIKRKLLAVETTLEQVYGLCDYFETQ